MHCVSVHTFEQRVGECKESFQCTYKLLCLCYINRIICNTLEVQICGLGYSSKYIIVRILYLYFIFCNTTNSNVKNIGYAHYTEF